MAFCLPPFSSAMKWIFLMTLFGVNFINIDGHCSECDLGTPADYDPNKLNGIWYLGYAAPNYWDQFSNVNILLKFCGSTYDTWVTGDFPGIEDTLFNGTWTLHENNKTFTAYYPTLTAYNTDFRVQATDNQSYFILRGCPPGLNNTNLRTIWLRERCPSKNTLKTVKKAVEELSLEFSIFFEDPIAKKSCK